MHGMFATAVALCLTAAPSPGARGLVSARALVDEFQFARALVVIGETLKEQDLDTATLITLYELEGIAHATSGAKEAARESFTRLLTLDPSHPLPAELPPKVRTLYFGAKTLAQRETLELIAEPPERRAGRIEKLEVSVKPSTVLPASSVRFTVLADDRPAVVTVVPLDGAHQPAVQVNAAHVKWTAELLSSRDAVLRKVERDEVPPVEVLANKPVAVTPPPPSATWVRPAGIAVGAAGLAGIGLGLVFAVQSADARAKIAQAATNADGVVVGITQMGAAQLDATARSSALTANILMAAGGGLTAAGLLMIVLAPSEPAAVSLSVGPGGLTASGRF